MNLIAVEPLNEQAIDLLRQLEIQHVIRLLPGEVTVLPPRTVDLGTLGGSISAAEAEQMQQDIAQSRNEWERNF